MATAIQNVITFSKYNTGNEWYAFPVSYFTSNGVDTPTGNSGWRIISDGTNLYFSYYGSTCSNANTISYSNLKFLYNNGFINVPNFDNLDSSVGYYLYFPVTPINGISASSTSYSYSSVIVDSKNPIIRTSVDNISSFCSTIPSSSNNTVSSHKAYISYSIDISDDSGSSSDNYNDLISAILMIPATIICLACMSVIYKMFINRRTRGES